MKTENNIQGKHPLFSAFAKGKKQEKASNSKCVIYTRVSSKEQTKGMSLETQSKDCESYATRNKMQIMGQFGGTYESAKTDERKEFNKMLSFVKQSKEKIGIIIVYSLDRFSRSGANAIYITDQLKKQGIVVYAVTQPSDASTSSGTLQQHIQFAFSEYENTQRKEKCMAGVREKLLAGIWCTNVPFGYDTVKRDGRQKEIILNTKGKLIKDAFKWRAMGQSNEDVKDRLAGRGLKISHQRLSALFRNPFYCGLIVHKALDGEIIEGIQEKAVSRELFLKVNGILSEKKKSGYAVTAENDAIPLKQFFRCDNCGRFLRAYKAYKNKKYYYKCNTLGCCCNKRAEELHHTFNELMERYSLKEYNEGLQYAIRQQVMAIYNRQTADDAINMEQLDKGISEIDRKLKRLRDRFAEEEITSDFYKEYSERYKQEKEALEKGLAYRGVRVSNLEQCIQNALNLSMKLSTVWHLSDYNGKQWLQFLLFPEGIYYNRKTGVCRTPKTNEIFSCISSLQRAWDTKKIGNVQYNLNVADLVAPKGIEPLPKVPETFVLSIKLQSPYLRMAKVIFKL